MEDREVVDDEIGDARKDYEMRTTARTIPASLIRRKEVASCQRRQRPSQSYAKASFGWNASSDRGVQVRFGLTCPFLRPACESSLNHDATTCPSGEWWASTSNSHGSVNPNCRSRRSISY